ncbi:MAG: ABC transporter permease [Eubacteriales bacterium]
MTAVFMALDSIFEKKMRSFLTMLGIIIGVTAVLVLVALVEGYNADVTAYYEKLGVNKVELSFDYLDSARGLDYTAQLQQDTKSELASYVSGVTPLSTQRNTTVSYGENVVSTSTLSFANEDYAVSANYILESGRELSVFDMENRSYVCVLGSYLADSLFPYTNPIGEKVLINGGSYLVIGTYYQKDGGTEGSMDDVLTIPYTLSRSLLGSAYPTEYVVKVSSSTMMDYVMIAMENWVYENISSTVATVEVVDGNSAMSASQEEMTSMTVVLGGVAGIALLVGGIGIMNIMLVTVSERTREIGIKKAIGAPDSDIITQFLVEAGILSALGGVIGVLLGFALSAILGKLMYDLITFPSLWVTVGSVLFSSCIGVIFGLYPAAKAAALQPVDALRID